MNDRESILIVEDSIDLQEVMKMLLEAEGYDVSIAGTGRDAIKQLISSPGKFSLVVLDNTLPDMMAPECLLQMRGVPMAESVPVILCSASANLNRLKLPSQVVGILAKPFEIDHMLSVIKTVISTAALGSPGLKTGFKNKPVEEVRHHA